MTLVTLTQQIVFGPLCSATLRSFASAAERNHLRLFFEASKFLFQLAAGVLIGIIALLALGLLWSGYVKWLPLLVAVGILSALSGYNSLLDGVQNAARQRSVVAWHQGVGQWLRYVLAVTAVLVIGASSTAAMLGYAVAAALVLGSQLAFFQQKIRPLAKSEPATQMREVREMAGQMWQYGWPFAVYGIFTWGQATSDRWSLQYFRSTSDVGLYQVLYQLSYYPMTMASVLLVQLATPILFARAGDGSDSIRVERTRHLVNAMVCGSIGITLVAVIAMVLLRERIFALLVAPQYRAAASVAPAMVLSAGLFACGQVAVLSLLASAQTRLLIAPKVVTAVVGTALNCLGAWRWGIKGVVAGSIVFSAVYLMWVLFLANRRRESVA
ncbi:MAG: lipopolysaccharide biosynthesis protein [Bryobacteraceae bacterium]